MVDFNFQDNVPKDMRCLLYLTFLVHGIGVSMPWNMLIVAEPYFANYKLGSEYGKSYLRYVVLTAQTSNLFLNWISIFLQIRVKSRIVYSISTQILIIIVTASLAMSDTFEWTGAFLWITLVSVAILSMANGIYQSTIFGMSAKLPMEYTSAVILGWNINGSLAAILDILSNILVSNILLKALCYFIIAFYVLVICLNDYIEFPLNKYYMNYRLNEGEEASVSYESDSCDSRVPYFYIFKKTLPQLFNIFFVFFVTLSLFPVVQSKVNMSDPDFLIPKELFTPVTCFFTFNIAASIGSYLTIFGTFPSPKHLVIPVVARVVLIPLFLFSNYHISSNLELRVLPILINNDWVYWIIAFTMGISSGYLGSLGMMYVSRAVEEKYASVAGMFGAAALATGFFGGVVVSLIWPTLINNIRS